VQDDKELPYPRLPGHSPTAKMLQKMLFTLLPLLAAAAYLDPSLQQQKPLLDSKPASSDVVTLTVCREQPISSRYQLMSSSWIKIITTSSLPPLIMSGLRVSIISKPRQLHSASKRPSTPSQSTSPPILRSRVPLHSSLHLNRNYGPSLSISSRGPHI